MSDRREQWIVKNLLSSPIIIGDLPKLPAIDPGFSFNMLLFHTKEEISRSSVLLLLATTSKVSLIKVQDGVTTTATVDNASTFFSSVEGNEVAGFVEGEPGTSSTLVPEANNVSSIVSIISATVNLKTESATTLYTVPAGHLFLIEQMEVLTSTISGTNTSLTVQFGDASDADKYVSIGVVSESAGYRHIVDSPQNAAVAGDVLKATISVASDATAHTGKFIIKGYLLEV